MTQTVKQLDLFEVLDEITQEEEEKRLKIQRKKDLLDLVRNGTGILTEFCDYITGVAEDGSYIHLIDESIRPSHFTISGKSISRRRNAQQFPNLKNAVKEASKRLFKNPNLRSYTINVHYSRDYNGESVYRGRTISHTLFFLHKDENNCITVSSSVSNTYKLDLSSDEKELVSNQFVPPSWVLVPKANPEVKALKDALGSFNVKNIYFTGAYTIREQKECINQVLSYCKRLKHNFSLNNIKPIQHLNFRNLRSASANYVNVTNTINLDGVSSFYHEYGHHIDYKLIKSSSNALSIYNQLIERLMKGTTMSGFKKKKHKEIEEYRDKVADNPYYRNYVRQSKDYYDYYVQPIEVFARFFASYCFFYYHDNSHMLLKFTQNEIEDATPLFHELMECIKLSKSR